MISSSLKQSIVDLFRQNKRYAGSYQYTVPAEKQYPFQWLWDSCFHAIILTRCGLLVDAKKELLSLVSHQFANGMLPHMIYWDKTAQGLFPIIKWGNTDTSTITQPPMVAYATWTIYQKTVDNAFLEKMYPHLHAYYDFLISDRETNGIHILGIINPDESGEDNSPRFDSALDLAPRQTTEESFQKRLRLVAENLKCDFKTHQCMSNFFWVKDVPFNTIMIKNLDILAQIADVIGRREDAKKYRDEATHIAHDMRRYMYEDGVFWPVFGQQIEKIKIKTWHIFAPLFAHLYSQEEAEHVVTQYLRTPYFATSFCVPTVATDEVAYDPQGFWRGPVWIGTNWFIYRGLCEYGFNEDAQKIALASKLLIEKSGLREQFHPETGVGMGATGFTWGGLILDMDES